MHSPSGSLLFSNSAHGDITTKHTYDLKMPSLKTMSFHSTSYQDTTEGHPALPRYHIKPPSLATLCTSLHFTCLYSITPALPPAHIIHEVWWCLNDYMDEHAEESWWGGHCSRTSLQAFNSCIPSRSWMNFPFSSKLFMTLRLDQDLWSHMTYLFSSISMATPNSAFLHDVRTEY